jgi:hypothetical protein
MKQRFPNIADYVLSVRGMPVNRTTSIEQGPSLEVSRFSASQEISCILWNPKVHYRIHKSSPPLRKLSQINPIIYININ